MKVKVMIADDNSFVREGMKIILTSFPEFDVVAAVRDGTEAVEYCKENEVDVALLDVRMPSMNGVEATRIISEQTKAKPLILTTFDDDEYILDAIKYGAKGYLLKDNDPNLVRNAIISVYEGNNVIQDVVLDRIKSNLVVDKAYEEAKPVSIDRSLFTEREWSIVFLIAKGLSNREISKQLFISEGTVANYVTTILGKTGLEHRTQIAIYYLTGDVDHHD